MDSIVVVYQTDNTKVDSKYLNNHCHENKKEINFVLFFRVTQKMSFGYGGGGDRNGNDLSRK